MPYFIYRVHAFPVLRLELVGRDDVFRTASARTKELRASPDLPQGCTVRMVFAGNELEAEDLLNQKRETAPGVVGDE
ncbi:MAG: hypothetical protein IPM22_18010 [Betaproteobacteria bacterium]|nr:hypothetical protein [Betaproteobacteria bacterium]MCC7216577.1 hypothetical protein [Burkholderiales bacterium]